MDTKIVKLVQVGTRLVIQDFETYKVLKQEGIPVLCFEKQFLGTLATFLDCPIEIVEFKELELPFLEKVIEFWNRQPNRTIAVSKGLVKTIKLTAPVVVTKAMNSVTSAIIEFYEHYGFSAKTIISETKKGDRNLVVISLEFTGVPKIPKVETQEEAVFDFGYTRLTLTLNSNKRWYSKVSVKTGDKYSIIHTSEFLTRDVSGIGSMISALIGIHNSQQENLVKTAGVKFESFSDD